MTPETRAARSLSGNSVQWLLAIGPAQRQRTAVGRWQEATGYFWILVGVVAMLGSFIPPLLAPFVGVPLADTIGWSWRREHGFNYASLYGFDGAFRIGFMYVLVARAEVESFVFNTIFLRSMIVAPFGAILTWLGLLFMGVSAMVVFIDIFTPVTTLLIWEQTRYRERFRHGDPGKSWWKVWLSLPQTDYRRTRISYVLEYEAVLQGSYFLLCMVFPSLVYSAPGFFEPRFELGMLSATAGLLFITVGLTPIVLLRSGGLYGGRGIWAARYVIWTRWLSLTSGVALCLVGLVPWTAWLLLHWVNIAGLAVTTVAYLREPERDNQPLPTETGAAPASDVGVVGMAG